MLFVFGKALRRFQCGNDQLGAEETSPPSEAFGPLSAYSKAKAKEVEAHAIEGRALLRRQEKLELLELLLCHVERPKIPRLSRKFLLHVVGRTVVADAGRKAAVGAVLSQSST